MNEFMGNRMIDEFMQGHGHIFRIIHITEYISFEFAELPCFPLCNNTK
jgi:hypothetical protein